MTVFLFLIVGILIFVLIFMAGMQPTHAHESLFELRRRQRMRDKLASDDLRREALLAQASVLSEPLRAIILVVLAALLIYLLGWLAGLIGALIIGLIYSRVARVSLVSKAVNRIYRRSEAKLLNLVAKYKKPIRLVGGKKILNEEARPIESREEVIHLIELSSVFTGEDKKLLENTFKFKDRTAKELMTPKDEVVTVPDEELLGPLVLDDLHKTRHTIFPVMKNEKVVGLLDSSDHFDLHSKESVHVRSVMNSEIVMINQDTKLDEALRTLLTVKEQLAIVADEDELMVGVLSLKDVVRALTG